MATSGSVFSLVSALVDVAVAVTELPERGGDVVAGRAVAQAGGGFNLVAAVARQGTQCIYAGPIGDGPYGRLIAEALEAENITASARVRSRVDTGFCFTMVEPGGERTFVTVPGAEASLTRQDLAAIDPARGDVVCVSGYDLVYPISGPVLGEWLEHAQEALVVFDPGPLFTSIPDTLVRTALNRSSVVTVNQREARAFSEAPELFGIDLNRAMRERASLAESTLLVLREGEAGCVATGMGLPPAGITVAAPSVRAVDTTGAGDTHTGVLASELASGADLAPALLRATWAAAISVTRVGSSTAPTRDELMRAGAPA